MTNRTPPWPSAASLGSGRPPLAPKPGMGIAPGSAVADLCLLDATLAAHPKGASARGALHRLVEELGRLDR